MRVDLIWLSAADSQCSWALGEVWPTRMSPPALKQTIAALLKSSEAQAWLFWDSALGTPNPENIEKVLTCPGDVWHAGLRLGLHGLPGLIDFVAPTSMLTRDPPKNIEATSWRLSLRCCLMRPAVIRQMGNIHPEFNTLEGASLELGYRYVRWGVLTRHIPWLLPREISFEAPQIPFEDEIRFIYYAFGPFRAKWALLRGILTKMFWLLRQ